MFKIFMTDIDFVAIEKKWQDRWEEEGVFWADDSLDKPRYYVLEMFPYPSGNGLHMGHTWNYTIGDIIARFQRMKGFNVLHPMGYDALGLPAENAAIKDGVHPEDYTKKSISNFIAQQKALGLSYDWGRVLSSSDPEYYKWDQWIFLKMFEKGLAYQKKSNVNWCPSCKTVLANEQAQSGECDRCGSKVEIKRLTQWFLRITDYADELYENLKNMDWPERTKLAQKNWIGKSYGAEIDFEINGEKWPVFTTRADTIFGVTFVVVSLQHSKLWDLVTKERRGEVEEFLKNVKTVSEKDLKDTEKQGVFTGSYAINPATGEKVPVYAGNFVVADYGSGMVMAVPAHDQRDFEFAKKYGIDIKVVVSPSDFELDEKNISEAYIGKGVLVNSGKFTGRDNHLAKKEIVSWLSERGVGRETLNFRLRDWGISRQRYWGTPIPIIHCKECGAVAVKEEDLPVKLPRDVKFGEGNPLETNEEWLNVKCPKCGMNARREADTMDTFVNSSWYFMRYCDPKNDSEIFNKDKVSLWCPVDTYIGGAEHACMHLIYSRFYVKFLRDIGLVNFDEPAVRLFHQGMLHGEDGNKMSKSKNNGVLPEEVSSKYGIDTARFFLSSIASPDKDIEWSEKGISGSFKFIEKVMRFVDGDFAKEDSEELVVKLNLTIKNLEDYYFNFKYRKATIELRELFDLMQKNGATKESFEKFLIMLNPICPHITEELWEKLGGMDFICRTKWPEYDEDKLKLKRKEVNLNEKMIQLIKPHLEKGSFSKVHLYVIPFQMSLVDGSILKKELGVEVFVYSVKDPDKYDPGRKAKKAKVGMPSFYLE